MTAWFPKGIPVLSGDELTRARELKKVECRLSIHEANEILLDQCGESVPIAEAAWTGQITFAFEGERQSRKYANALETLPIASDALKHIEITVNELNRWLQEKHPWVRYRFPVETGQVNENKLAAMSSPIDFEMLATRQKLIDAFGSFTGMDASWFTNLKDTPRLKATRKVAGSGGKNSTEPLFCPYLVMEWLIDPKRKKGRKLSRDAGWRTLESHFKTVYNHYSIGDPRND